MWPTPRVRTLFSTDEADDAMKSTARAWMIAGFCSANLLAANLLTGCAGEPIRTLNVVLTSGASVHAGKRTPVHRFGHDDYVWQLVDFSWSNLDQNGGIHRCTWNWYRNGVLVSKTPQKYLRFGHSPYTLETHRPAAALGVGQFRVETVVDDQVVATSSFDIVD